MSRFKVFFKPGYELPEMIIYGYNPTDALKRFHISLKDVKSIMSWSK